MKKLYINGRFLTQHITGVQRVGIELVKQLDKIATSDEIEILVPLGRINNLVLKNIKLTTIGKMSNNFWTQITLPLYVKKNNGILLTITGLNPVIFPGYYISHDITSVRYPQSFSKAFLISSRIGKRLNLKRCKHIFTVSEFSKNELKEYYGILERDITVIYPSANHLLDQRHEERNISKWGLERKKYYLSVGSQNFHKNQVYIYRCAQKYPDVKFVIVGGVSKSFRQTGVKETNNLITTGYVSEDELYTLYKHAAGFIFPSLYEGFGIPPLEAIIAGVCCVAVSDISVFREVYDKNVYFFDPLDVHSFNLEKMNSYRLDEKNRQYYMDKYNWEKSAAIIYNKIKEKENEDV